MRQQRHGGREGDGEMSEWGSIAADDGGGNSATLSCRRGDGCGRRREGNRRPLWALLLPARFLVLSLLLPLPPLLEAMVSLHSPLPQQRVNGHWVSKRRWNDSSTRIVPLLPLVPSSRSAFLGRCSLGVGPCTHVEPIRHP